MTIFWCSLSYIFLLSPMIVVMGASFQGGEFNTAIRFPPDDPSIQWYLEIPRDQITALGISLALASVAALGACVIGIPAALGIVRSNLKLKTVISAVFRSPLQIPAVVSGIAFLQLFYAIGDTTGVYWQGTIYTAWPSGTSSSRPHSSSVRWSRCCNVSTTVSKRLPSSTARAASGRSAA